MSDFLDFISSRSGLTWLSAIGATGALTFVVLYAWRSVGWWRSPAGRNIMATSAVLLILLALVVAARAWGPLPGWIWAIGMITLDTVIWQRVVVLWHKQHERTKL